MADYRGQLAPPKPQEPEFRLDMAGQHSSRPPLPTSAISEQPTFNPTPPTRLDPEASLRDDTRRPPRDDRPRPPMPASGVTGKPASESQSPSRPRREGSNDDRPSRDESFFSRPALTTSRDESFFSRPALTTSVNTEQPASRHSPAGMTPSPGSGRSPRDATFFSRPALSATQPNASPKDGGNSGQPQKDEAFFSRPALPSSAIADHPMFENPLSREQSPSPRSGAPQACAEDYLSRPAKMPPFNSSHSRHSNQSPPPRSSLESERSHRNEAFVSRPAVSSTQQASPSNAKYQSGAPRRDEGFFSRPALPASAIADHPMFDQSPLGSRSGTPRSGTPPRSPGTCFDMAEGDLFRPAKLPPFNSPQPTFGNIHLTSSTDLASVSELDPELGHGPGTPRDDSAHNATGILRSMNLRKPRSVPRSQSLKREKDTKHLPKPTKAEMLSQAQSRTSLLDGQESSAPVEAPSGKLLRTTQW